MSFIYFSPKTALLPTLFLLAATLLCPNKAKPQGWSNEFGPSGFSSNSKVSSSIEYQNNLVVAGSFGINGHPYKTDIAQWDGEQWVSLDICIANIKSLGIYNNQLFAGGLCRSRSPATQSLLYWDGQVWQVFSDKLEGEVHAICTFKGDLVVGGLFTISGDNLVHNLARWDGEKWHSLGTGISGGGRTRVQALTVHGDELFVGGVFGQAGEVQTYNIASWNGDLWSGYGTGSNAPIMAICSTKELLYVGGEFSEISEKQAACIAVWDGKSWSALDAGISNGKYNYKQPTINAIQQFRGNIVVAGLFDTVDNLDAKSIATWDGKKWQASPPGVCSDLKLKTPAAITSLSTYKDRLVVGGNLATTQTAYITGLGLWDNKQWDPLVKGLGGHGDSSMMTIFAGELIMPSSRTRDSHNLGEAIVWKKDHWQSFNFSRSDSSLLLVRIGMITEHYGNIMGVGRRYDSMPSSYMLKKQDDWRILQWDDGWKIVSTSLPWRVIQGYSLLSMDDKLVLTGQYLNNENIKEQVVVWDGHNWSFTDLPVKRHRLKGAVVNNNRLYLARNYGVTDERFTSVISEWDGTSWRNIKEGDGVTISAMGVWNNMVVVANNVGSNITPESHNLHCWDGQIWQPIPGDFTNRYPKDGHIVTLASYQGFLVAGGNFEGIDKIACTDIAFFDGEIWRPLANRTDNRIRKLVPQSNSLWVGGSFSWMGNTNSYQVARWDGPLPISVPRDSLPAFQAEERPAKKFGGDLHSHGLEITNSATPFSNGNFESWSLSTPAHWNWSSTWRGNCIAQADGGIQIFPKAGKVYAATITQRFAIEGGKCYRIRVKYAAEFQPTEHSLNPCMLSFTDYKQGPSGNEYGPLHHTVRAALDNSHEEWAEIVLRVDEAADVGVIWLSACGEHSKLTIHEVQVETVTMTGDIITRLLIEELRKTYVPQSDIKIDWEDLENQFTNMEITEGSKPRNSHVPLLRALGDPRFSTSKRTADMSSGGPLCSLKPIPRHDTLTKERKKAIKNQLIEYHRDILFATTGWTQDGFGYLAPGPDAIGVKNIDDFASAEGIIFDLREYGRVYGTYDNNLRDQEYIHRLASRFVDDSRIYGFYQSGTGASVVEDTLRLSPSTKQQLTMPIVCLIGSGCKGNGAEFALMMSTLPNVTLVGRPTLGGTGNPISYMPPTGRPVIYPGARLLNVDRELVTDMQGVQPDVLIEPTDSDNGDGPTESKTTLDPVFEAGLRILREKIAAAEK